VNREKNNLQH